MTTRLRIYVEGGGQGALRNQCRQAFKQFFEKTSLRGRLPRVIACGPRNRAFDDFETALQDGRGPALLLVDSEAPVEAPASPWEHLEQRDAWKRPGGVDDDSCYLMVQCMEHWFLADREALASFFGQDFRPQDLPSADNVETLNKEAVFLGLKKATKQSSKGAYGKGNHSFKILGLLDPARVRAAAPHAERLLSYLEKTL